MDSDWAREAERKSTSGGRGGGNFSGVAVKHWSRSHASRALSVWEAEYSALVTGCAQGLRLQSLRDMGWEARVRVMSDSTTAKAVACRRGFGKLRHVELMFLWVQEMVKRDRLSISWIPGESNVAYHSAKEKCSGSSAAW